MEFVSLKSPSMMLPSSQNSLQSFDSAKVINIHELVELIGPLPCIITGDWSEELRLRWTRAGPTVRPWEKRFHTSRPRRLCNGAHRVGRTMGCGARARPSTARSSPASRLPVLLTSQKPARGSRPPRSPQPTVPPSSGPHTRDLGAACLSRRRPVRGVA